MSDSYQAIYDAVRTRISNGNVGEVIREVAWSCFDISHMKSIIQQEILITLAEQQRPSVVFKATLDMHFGIEGGPYQAMHGGRIYGVGKSPDEAMRNFDLNWAKPWEFPKKETEE